MALNLSDIRRSLKDVFQGMLKNLVSLADDSTLEGDAKPIKIGDKVTPLELSETEVKVGGTLSVNGSQVITESSVIDGMILGYTRVFDSDASPFQTTTTSHVNLNKNFDSADHFLKVTFVVPPSNKFEIEVFLPYVFGADSYLELGLATDESATALDDKYSQRVWDVDETDTVQIRHTWFVDGSDHSWVAGQSRTIYATVKHGDTGCRIYMCNGGLTLGGWVMKVISLPSIIEDGT